jgi:hypothetical protein
MMNTPHKSLNLPRTLEDGLILRLATANDTDVLAEFNTRIHEDDAGVGVWTRDLMSEKHPTTSLADFVIVEDPAANNKIVSTSCLIPQTWYYEGIPFATGQPELIGTDEKYRRRGLCQKVMEVIHQLGDAHGHQMQYITGIPWFYRQFGYEFVMELDAIRVLPVGKIESLKEGETEQFEVRPATEDDIPVLIRLYERQDRGKMVTNPRDEILWKYALSGQSEDSEMKNHVVMVLDADKEICGYYISASRLYGETLQVNDLSLDKTASYYDAVPFITRTLKAQGEQFATDKGEGTSFGKTGFRLGLEHPVYDVLGRKLDQATRPYAYYVRVPDIVGFIKHVTPVLETRLANSPMQNFTGELKLGFYRDGLHLTFEKGKMTNVIALTAKEATAEKGIDAKFPPLVFLKVLFCYRQMEEIGHIITDCGGNKKSQLMLKALFPKKLSRTTHYL